MRPLRTIAPLFAAAALCICSFSQSEAFRQTPARPTTAAALIAERATRVTDISPEQKVDKVLQSSKSNSGHLYAFLRQMPKGGDLHNHFTGAVYAESFVKWAMEADLCVDRASLQLASPPCKDPLVPVRNAASDMTLYRSMIDAWSMRGWHSAVERGHTHFFDTFTKFDLATRGRGGDMLAEITQRAAFGNVTYLEIMTTPDEARSLGLGSKIGWDDDFAVMRQKMLDGGIQELVVLSKHNMDAWESRKNELLGCTDRQKSKPGCSVKVRQIYTVLRAFSREQVFAQLLVGFELSKQDPRLVGVNLVQPEDYPIPMNDFHLQMRMMDFFHKLYPGVHISLHAGELAPGLVPPDGLRSHIRESIMLGHAERIGHGVDVMYESDPRQLLAEMERRGTMVEICLTSNASILGIKGKEHPLHEYLDAGVPVALATDDEGVSRSEMTREYERAVEDQGLDYPTLKKMARTSLEHSFLPGASLWTDGKKFAMVRECVGNMAQPNPTCQRLLNSSEKAQEQWKLEKKFVEFEAKF